MSQRDEKIPEKMKVQRSASIKRHRSSQSVRKYVTRIFSSGFRFLIGLWILAQVHCTPLVVTNLPRPEYYYRYRTRQICRLLIPPPQSKISIALAIHNKYMSPIHYHMVLTDCAIRFTPLGSKLETCRLDI